MSRVCGYGDGPNKECTTPQVCYHGGCRGPVGLTGHRIMGFRVDKIRVEMNVYVEFEGHRDLAFEYVPAPDDPLVAAALAKNDLLNKAAMDADIAKGNLADPTAFL